MEIIDLVRIRWDPKREWYCGSIIVIEKEGGSFIWFEKVGGIIREEQLRRIVVVDVIIS